MPPLGHGVHGVDAEVHEGVGQGAGVARGWAAGPGSRSSSRRTLARVVCSSSWTSSRSDGVEVQLPLLGRALPGEVEQALHHLAAAGGGLGDGLEGLAHGAVRRAGPPGGPRPGRGWPPARCSCRGRPRRPGCPGFPSSGPAAAGPGVRAAAPPGPGLSVTSRTMAMPCPVEAAATRASKSASRRPDQGIVQLLDGAGIQGGGDGAHELRGQGSRQDLVHVAPHQLLRRLDQQPAGEVLTVRYSPSRLKVKTRSGMALTRARSSASLSRRASSLFAVGDDELHPVPEQVAVRQPAGPGRVRGPAHLAVGAHHPGFPLERGHGPDGLVLGLHEAGRSSGWIWR